MGNPIGREAIYSALFAQLSAVLLVTSTPTPGPFNYGGRRPVTDSGLGAEQYPAFLMMETGEIWDRTTLFAPATVSLLVTLSIQTVQGDVPDEEAVPALNNLADYVESAIENGGTDCTGANTLGGLVQKCWINHRQLVVTGSYPQRIFKQNFMIEMVLPHSR